MVNNSYQPATVLLYDPDPALRHNTRSALLNIGFGDVVAIQEFNEFIEKTSTKDFDLVLADSRAVDGDPVEAVRKIRRHVIGKNPFVNVIVSLWNTTPETVTNAINSGADDVISRPMSRTHILERVGRLVRARKPFIVTPDYLGPDRRQVPRGYPQGSAMVVPNSLQAKIENRPEFAATPEAIQAAMNAVNDRKISIFTEQLIRLSSAILLLSDANDGQGDRENVIQALRQINDRLSARIKGTALTPVLSLCEGLNDLLDNIGKSGKILEEQEQELLKQIPYAIHKGCKEVQQSASLAFDIRDLSLELQSHRTLSRSSV
ncbi:response regulator [Sneathiella marina]|uniref:Response regulator n=1 Tax=Sneathiella marina TaxID=2950108 RepID=A0ABY4W3W0_9PROT|nr:response regulator [Sneathiella marina]USG61728.1 response regulator [Sneathiella marina]